MVGPPAAVGARRRSSGVHWQAGQALEGKEVLNLRWANEDPNPKVRADKILDAQAQLLQAAHECGQLEQSGKRVGHPPVAVRAPGGSRGAAGQA